MDTERILQNIPIGGRVIISGVYREVSPFFVYVPLAGMDRKARTCLFEYHGFKRDHHKRGQWVRVSNEEYLTEYRASKLPEPLIVNRIKAILQADKEYTDKEIKTAIGIPVKREMIDRVMFDSGFVFISGKWKYKDIIKEVL